MFFTVILGLLSGWLFYIFLSTSLRAVKRWREGFFKPAQVMAICAAFYLAIAGLTAWGSWVSNQVRVNYDRVGAERVEHLGSREGFEAPVVAYTDRETGKLCIGERVGGEEFLVEVECIDPPE